MESIHPSATVIPIREAGKNIEALLLRRNPELSFHGGAWVFPGGRVDSKDYRGGRNEDSISAARHAAVREAKEEAGLTISPDSLLAISHWTTPTGLPRRFKTWFFVADAKNETVCIDGGEIHAFQWMKPSEALDKREKGKIILPPPTFVTLKMLSEYKSVESVMSNFSEREPLIYLPKLVEVPGGFCSLYQGDAAYKSKNIDKQGPRNRLWILEKKWHYEKSG
jgi:8-oxo-dGTP pyrophosphatase MutT (NUDIX family)